jgi:hypothetical protein
MRDKQMRSQAKRRTGITARVARRVGRASYARSLAAFVFALRLVLSASASDYPEQKQRQNQAAAPDVQITHVKGLSALNDRMTTDVEIRWTAQVPRSTTIDEFDVLLEVRYSDGSKGTARSHQLKPSARAAIVALATHPRQNANAILKDFRAAVKVSFRIAAASAVVQQVTASQSTGVRPPSGTSSHPEVSITATRLFTQGCSTGRQCVDLKWTVTAPRNIFITEFTASVEALHADGMKSTDSKTVSNQERQARLQAGPANVGVNSMRVSLLTSFSLLESKTAVKEGTFSFDSLKG